jgi:hypothetical protein
MAIVVEEGEKKTNILGIMGWLVFLGIAAAAVYYVFFAQPELVTISSSGSLSTIAPITQVSLQPDAVMKDAAFQALKTTISLPTAQGPASVGRTNPFVAP